MDIFSFGMCALEVLAPCPRGLASSQLPAPPPCAVTPWCLTSWPCLQMAVLEIQANGDTRVTEEAVARARHSLSDPNMRVSSLPAPQVGLGRCFRQAWRCNRSMLPRHVQAHLPGGLTQTAG